MAETLEEVKTRIEFVAGDDETETEDVQTESEETASQDQVTEGDNQAEGEQSTSDEQEEPVYSFGDEAAPASNEQDNSVIRELRALAREQAKKLKELESKAAPQAETPRLPEKPTLESCDYDEEAFESALTNWYEAKKQVEAAEKAKEDELRQAQEAQQQRVQAYQARAAELKVKDFKEAEEEVIGALSVAQQAILWGADDTTALVYALGKHPEKLKELAAIKDPAKFAFAAAKLETQMKVTTRKPKVQPESKVAPGAGSLSGGSDATLERLRAEAEKTGDYSKVGAYRRAQMHQKT